MKWARLVCSALVGVVVTAVVLAAAPVALAQNAPDFEAAKQHYFAAKEAARHSDWDTAVKEYQAAYGITKDPSLYKQIGATYEAAGKNSDAAAAYKVYLADTGSPPDGPEIAARITRLEAAPSSSNPPVAKPAEPPASAPALPPAPAPIPPPPVPTPASAAGSQPHGASPVLEGVDLPAAPPPDFLSEGGRWQRTAAWVSVGLGAAALVTASVFVTSALSRTQDVQRLVDYTDPSTGLPKVYAGTVQDDYTSNVSEGNKLNTYAAIAFAGAAVCAGSAVFFFILDHKAARQEPSASVYVAPGGGGFLASWEF